MKVQIERLDHQGRGIGKVDGKTVFVPNTLPDEIVEIDIISNKKKYMIGDPKHFLKTSVSRVKPICPYFKTCGGCDLMHLSYQDQLQYKESKVKDIMKRFAGIESNIIKPILGSMETLYYRNKVTFQVKHDIGFYEKKSSDIVPIDQCYIINQKMNEILTKLKKLSLKHIEQIVIRTDRKIEKTMIIFYISGKIEENTIISLFKHDATSIVTIKDKEVKCLYGKDTMIIPIGEYQFELSPTSFFQVNTKQCQQLYDKVVEYAKIKNTDTVLDLYCGTGTIGIYLSKFAKKVYGIEIHEAAIQNANRNKELNHVQNVSFKVGDVGKLIHNLDIKPDIIIVDPPRKGLDEKTIKQLLKWHTKKIVYVSCDPITLARDLKLLQEKYNIVEITPVDMFPETFHVECVASLSLKTLEK